MAPSRFRLAPDQGNVGKVYREIERASAMVAQGEHTEARAELDDMCSSYD
jgi:hypothetical protein